MTTQKEIQMLFDRYEKQMYHIAWQILQDSYLAEDAVLDAFVKILHNAYSFESPDSDQTKRLIIQIIRSSAIDIYRRNQKYREWIVSAVRKRQERALKILRRKVKKFL